MKRAGINRANRREYERYRLFCESNTPDYSKDDPCVFISHKKEDSEKAKELAEHIKKAGIDIFFDEEDKFLSNPETKKDPARVTEIINEALHKSTHMVCVVSKETQGSWWVPYEIGYAWDKKKEFYKNIRVLFVKDIVKLPEYLDIVGKIETTDEIDDFLREVANTSKLLHEQRMFTEFKRFSLPHPLSNILKS